MGDIEIINRGTWIDKVAYEIINREKKLGRDLSIIKTESGLGASGIPHVGSMADAVRAYVVTLALRDMGYNSVSIAFSDDMDGLRSIPQGLPKWLEDYLLMPVSMIPDPFECHSSYGEHMSSLLRESLDMA
ncbi:lysine--tRNA ligase, partial [Candidatus Geothermarchaeota archaeon]